MLHNPLIQPFAAYKRSSCILLLETRRGPALLLPSDSQLSATTAVGATMAKVVARPTRARPVVVVLAAIAVLAVLFWGMKDVGYERVVQTSATLAGGESASTRQDLSKYFRPDTINILAKAAAASSAINSESNAESSDVPADCFAEASADYHGDAVMWGMSHKTDTALECCRACQEFKLRGDGAYCNVWVFCPSNTGLCWSPDIWNHTSNECWLKYQKDWDGNTDLTKTNLVVNLRGAYSKEYRAEHKTAPERVQWTAGLNPKKPSAIS